MGSDNKRRTRIISQLLPIEFRIVLFIANKQEFINDTPLTEYKKSFIKFLHQRLYDMLYYGILCNDSDVTESAFEC